MSYISFQPSDHFNTKLWTGTGSSNAITGVGFQPDWVWIKNRDAAEHNKLFDAVRGANKVIYSNLDAIQYTVTQELKSFDSDGFTVGTETAVNANGQDIVGWNWKANGQGSSNTDGSINTTYTSVNTTAGFSISQYTGTGSNATVGHGLGVKPSMILVKRLDSTGGWLTYHSSVGATKYLELDSSGGEATNSTIWQDTEPTSLVFSLSTNASVNGSGGTFVAYCFAPIKGFSAMGSYTGTANADGAFVYTGMSPAWVMIKKQSGAGYDWVIFDNKRLGYNDANKKLVANDTDVEANTSPAGQIDLLSNGFKIRTTDGHIADASPYLYMAFSDQSIVSSNGVPAVAR